MIIICTFETHSLGISSRLASSFKELWIKDNQLSSLPENIGNLNKLESLNLSCNKLSSLPESIVYLKNLTYLYLSENNLSSLPGTIKKCLKLLEKNGCIIYL
ncbi:MAG: leucine-rich repeat domain-containing protein [Promethearchaeota archaeon]